MGLTPYRADFFDYVEVSIPVRDVTKMNYVVGIGTVIYRFQNDKGDDIFHLELLITLLLQTFVYSVHSPIIRCTASIALSVAIK